MYDTFEFESPLGVLGKIVNPFFLKKDMTNFLVNKNQVLKNVAESDNWDSLLS